MNPFSNPEVLFLAFALRPSTTVAEITGIVGTALTIAGVVILALGHVLWPGLDLASLWFWLVAAGIALGSLSMALTPKTTRPNFVNTVFDAYSASNPKE